MKIKSKVAKFTGDRKIVEIPTAVKDNFKIGEDVTIEKSGKNNSRSYRSPTIAVKKQTATIDNTK
jgi:hypothetical protein